MRICKVKIEHGVPISINSRAISPFQKGFHFAELLICEVLQKIKTTRKSEFLVGPLLTENLYKIPK